MRRISEQGRICCPDSHLSREHRIGLIIEEFDRFLSTESFLELVGNYGGQIPGNVPTVEKIHYLKDSFVDIWDYRKRQREALTSEGEAARWLLENSEREIKNSDLIIKAAYDLGLIGVTESLLDSPDYFLPLGGAKMSNLYRCLISAAEINRIGKPAKVVALSALRLISDSERECVDSYAPGALTEYDAITAGMQRAFPLISLTHEEKYDDERNVNLSYRIGRFTEQEDHGGEYFTVAAPSSDPSRRANSNDCFRFFFDRFKVMEHSKLVNCSSQIYCPYQQVRALFYAIEYNVVFDTIGYRIPESEQNVTNNSGLSKPVQYLQEMKSTIDAMYDFVTAYAV